MTVLYSNDFEATATGALSGFTQVNGGAVVTNGTNGPAGPVRGTKSLMMASDGDGCSLTAESTRTDQAVRTAQKYVATSMVQNVLRASGTNGAKGYWCLYEKDPSGNNIRARILVRDSALITSAEGAYDIVVSAGQVVHMESRVVGTTIEHRVWVGSGTARPSSPTVSLTNSLHASGMPGVRKAGSFEWTAVDDLVITDALGGEDAFYPPGPSISAHPSSQTVTAPATATFSVTAAAGGGGTLSYQWQRSTNAGGSWANVTTGTGGTTNSYTTPATTVTGGNANNADQFRCVVTETGGTAAGTVNSNAATLTVNAAAAGPTINTQPSNATVTAPGTAAFTVAATASAGSLSYQWQRSTNSGGSWANVTTGTGGTAASYTTAATSVSGGNANSGDQYRCAVTDSNGTVNTSAATLTVNAAAAGLTSSALKTNAGVLHLSAPFEAFVLNVTTGALVVRKTGLTSNGTTGVVTFTDASLTAATQYRVVWRRTDTGAQGVELLTAA